MQSLVAETWLVRSIGLHMFLRLGGDVDKEDVESAVARKCDVPRDAVNSEGAGLRRYRFHFLRDPRVRPYTKTHEKGAI